MEIGIIKVIMCKETKLRVKTMINKGYLMHLRDLNSNAPMITCILTIQWSNCSWSLTTLKLSKNWLRNCRFRLKIRIIAYRRRMLGLSWHRSFWNATSLKLLLYYATKSTSSRKCLTGKKPWAKRANLQSSPGSPNMRESCKAAFSTHSAKLPAVWGKDRHSSRVTIAVGSQIPPPRLVQTWFQNFQRR